MAIDKESPKAEENRRAREHAAHIADEARIETLARIRAQSRLDEQQALAAHVRAEQEKVKAAAAERAAQGLPPIPAKSSFSWSYKSYEGYLIGGLLITGSLLLMLFSFGYFDTKPSEGKPQVASGEAQPAMADKPAQPAEPAPQVVMQDKSAPPVAAAPSVAAAPQAAQASPAATPQPAVEPAIRQNVTQWAEAWSRRDLAAYLSSYAADFKPPQGMSRTDWEAQRKVKLGKYKSIAVTLKNVTVSVTGSDAASVTFAQDFKGDSFREMGTKKELRLKKIQDRWLIVSEAEL